jgi:hypothetical protein
VKLVSVFVLLVLGSLAFAQDRDQTQISNVYSSKVAFFKPFAGTYTGSSKVGNAVEEISLYLEPSDEIGEGANRALTIVPSMKGEVRICMSESPCFSKDPYEGTNSVAVYLTSALRDPADPNSIKVYSAGEDYIFYLKLTSTGLTGTVFTDKKPTAQINVTRLPLK